MQDFRPQLRQFIQDNFIMGSRGPQFGDADSFMDKHIIDSTGFLELITYIEETWNIAIEDKEMVPENLDSLDALQAFITRKTAA